MSNAQPPRLPWPLRLIRRLRGAEDGVVSSRDGTDGQSRTMPALASVPRREAPGTRCGPAAAAATEAPVAGPVNAGGPGTGRLRLVTPMAARVGGVRRSAPVRCTVDPGDDRRTLISGRMGDVCDALDRLIARQAAQPRVAAETTGS